MVLYLVIWLLTVWKTSVKSAHFHLVDYRDCSLRGGSDQRMENLVCTDCRKSPRDALIGRNECVMYPQTLYCIQMEMFPSIGQSPSLYYLKVERLQQNHVTVLCDTGDEQPECWGFGSNQVYPVDLPRWR